MSVEVCGGMINQDNQLTGETHINLPLIKTNIIYWVKVWIWCTTPYEKACFVYHKSAQ